MKKLFLLILVGLVFAGMSISVLAAEITSNQLEIFSWWTVGGEATGLKALFDEFHAKYPDVEIINAAVGTSAGSTAKAVLVSRMLGGDPPDAFQVHGGQELIDTWVKTGKMVPVTDIYESEGWNKVMPEGIRNLVAYDGEYWAVPIGIHRGNVLWFNKDVFAKYNLDIPVTFEDFFKVAEVLKENGLIPLALGSKSGYEIGMTFENVLMGTLGAERYRDLWTGKTSWSDSGVTKALETFKKMLAYVNKDHSALTWDAAMEYIIAGKAAMLIQGDWVDGWIKAKNLTDFNYGWATAPGTYGQFMGINDTFAIPKGAPHQDAAMEFLRIIGSKEAQEKFAPFKGCIPVRTDTDTTKFNDYQKWSLNDWADNEIVASCVHGSAAKESWVTEYKDTINLFAADLDVVATQKALVSIAEEALAE